MISTGIVLRRARLEESDAIAALHRASRLAAMPSIDWPHGAEEDRHWVRTHLFPSREIWVLEEAGNLLGMLALHEDWIDQLYLAPGTWRRRLGSRLIAHAKAARPDGLRLYCFEVNAHARAFYEHHGFAAVQFGDGTQNDEGAPDILYVWPHDRPHT